MCIRDRACTCQQNSAETPEVTGIIRFTAFTFLIVKKGDYPQKIWDGMMYRKIFLINTQKFPV